MQVSLSWQSLAAKKINKYLNVSIGRKWLWCEINVIYRQLRQLMPPFLYSQKFEIYFSNRLLEAALNRSKCQIESECVSLSFWTPIYTKKLWTSEIFPSKLFANKIPLKKRICKLECRTEANCVGVTLRKFLRMEFWHQELDNELSLPICRMLIFPIEPNLVGQFPSQL